MLLSVYALVALVSTALATPTPTHELKQASRAQVVRRLKRGLRPRAPVPSSAGMAPTRVTTNAIAGKGSTTFSRYFTGSRVLLSSPSSGDASDFPSVFATYPNDLTTEQAAQNCVNLAWEQGEPGEGAEYLGAALWFDESDNLWHCRATFGQNQVGDFTAPDGNANPVYGYNRG